MDRILVRPTGPLSGAVRVSGATKNSGTKLMAAALLASGRATLSNLPPVRDLDVMIELLAQMGVVAEWSGADALGLDTRATIAPEAPYELVTRMRASINVLGPLVARHGRARVALPGGDNIGSRKIDMHLRGLEAMGADVGVEHGYVVARTDRLTGARHVLEFPSVGATENLLTAATLAKGTTVIDNAAREPEITDLGAHLNRMGAHVVGTGTSTIEIEGVDELTSVDGAVMGDRVEAGQALVTIHARREAALAAAAARLREAIAIGPAEPTRPVLIHGSVE